MLLHCSVVNSKVPMACASELDIIVLKYRSMLDLFIPCVAQYHYKKYALVAYTSVKFKEKSFPFSFCSSWESPHASIYKDFNIWIKLKSYPTEKLNSAKPGLNPGFAAYI